MSSNTLNKSEREKLFQAAKDNDLKTVKHFIEEKGEPMMLENEDGEAVAHIAAKYGHFDIVKYMMEEPSLIKWHLGSKSNYTTTTKLYDHGLTILDDAVFAGALDIVKYLVEKYNINLFEAREFERILFTTMSFDRLNILKYFIEEKGVDVNAPYKSPGEPPVFLALKYKRPEIVKYLVEEKKADLKVQNFLNENILYPTAEAGNLPFMKYLLDERKLEFDINWTDYLGRTAAYMAVASNQLDVLKYLVEEKHADVNIPEYISYNTTCLHKAVSNNNYEISEYLVEKGANIEDRNTYGRVKNERLIKLLEIESTSTRNRRSVDLSHMILEPILSPYTKNLSGAAGHSGNSAATLSSDAYYYQFQNFLLVAGFVIKNAKSYIVERCVFSSPRRSLRNRMDPIAVEAVNNSPYFIEP